MSARPAEDAFTLDYLKVAAPDERRAAERCQYRAVVKIAPYDGRTLPPPADFCEVETRDLAPTGMSFFSPGPPPAESLILMLGDPQDPIYLSARVVHCQECHWSRRKQCFVGCEFTGRLS